MRARRLVSLLACALLAGCASEGGVTGSGISSVSGNVIQVSEDAAAALPFPIRVTVAELPSATAVTDAAGAFALSGDFSGAITLEFVNAADGTAIGPLALEVPAGSSTVLENIEIRLAAPPPQRVRPRAIRQLDVFGTLDLAECDAAGGGVLLVRDDGRPARQFLITLTPETAIARRDGAPLACADLLGGRRPQVQVEGLLRAADLTIIAVQVTVGGPRPSRPPDELPRPERLQGVATTVACGRGIIEMTQLLEAERVRRTLRLDDATSVRCAGTPPVPCACADIAAGDGLAVSGILRPDRPGLVDAEVIVVTPSRPSR